ncbi:hypothetical protein LTR72_012087 [Exophiala xenobiotica]|nr:hypothetical protein LTR92_011709 [Exophiala xenobiotica]KAK5214791.1 hypothetical protein LTR72_012087 [Exophiala xenobiotica]KAK5344486.1 hypothetical protein LTR61_011749 [Exophiala xenobiotica]KAK5356045.1 hypothetical protein LTR11_011718 [Exophiala xenobiotica]
MNIACLRIHEVAPLPDVQKEHIENWESSAVKPLWGWVHPQAVARACLLSVQKADDVNGFEIFNIVAPTTTQDITSEELARRKDVSRPIPKTSMGMKTFGADDHIAVGKYCHVDQASCLGQISQSAEGLKQGASILDNCVVQLNDTGQQSQLRESPSSAGPTAGSAGD